ncbi:MAG: hypothetical protein J6A01_07145 [Proteobacteria bacterium]|nr:hypothetical protein [Pseudomonadota bacterium]
MAETSKLNPGVLALWGKKAANGEPKWLPLIVHLANTAEIGKILWEWPAYTPELD